MTLLATPSSQGKALALDSCSFRRRRNAVQEHDAGEVLRYLEIAGPPGAVGVDGTRVAPEELTERLGVLHRDGHQLGVTNFAVGAHTHIVSASPTKVRLAASSPVRVESGGADVSKSPNPRISQGAASPSRPGHQSRRPSSRASCNYGISMAHRLRGNIGTPEALGPGRSEGPAQAVDVEQMMGRVMDGVTGDPVRVDLVAGHDRCGAP